MIRAPETVETRIIRGYGEELERRFTIKLEQFKAEHGIRFPPTIVGSYGQVKHDQVNVIIINHLSKIVIKVDGNQFTLVNLDTEN